MGCQQPLCRKRRVKQWTAAQSQRAIENGPSRQRPGSLHEMFRLTQFRLRERLPANMLDGMVAIASSRTSKTGELYNEVPDRVSDAAVFIGAGFAWGGNITLGYIATILAIFTAYVRAAGKIAGAPNEFCGPMAKQHRMLVITVICLYSAVIPRPWQILHFDNVEVGVMSFGLGVIIVGCCITIVRRLNRIAHALR